MTTFKLSKLARITTLCFLALSTTPALLPAVQAQTASKLELGPLLNVNGGFENGKSSYYFTKPTLSFIDNDEVYRGAAALRLQGEGKAEPGEANIGVQGYKIPTPGANTQYLFRIAVKAKDIDPKFPPSIQFRREDAAKKVTVMNPEKGMLRADADWKVLEISSGPLPADTATLAFWLHLPAQSKATIWCDEIEIRPILNPPAETAPAPMAAPPTAPAVAPANAPKPPVAAAPGPQEKPVVTAAKLPGGADWQLELNRSALNIYERGEPAYATLRWQGTGAAATPPPFFLVDEKERKLADLKAEVQGDAWRLPLPTARMGYYEIRPQVADPAAVIPALGSRPAGKLTFAVVDKINSDPSRGFTQSFLSSQGTTILGQRDGQNYGWDMLPYMGVQAQGVGYQWGRLEAGGAENFDKNIAQDRQPKWVKELGIVPYFHLNSVPMWAAKTELLPEKERAGASSGRVPPRDLKDYEAFLRKVVPYIVRNYDFLPQRTYEVMWEPVIPWGWYGTNEDIAAIFSTANRVIHELDPKARIAGPTLSGLNDTALFETLLQTGLARTLDVVAFHPYKGYPPERNAIPEALANIRAITRKQTGKELPFIGTEFGFPQGTTGSALNQGYGLTTSILIFKGEGARMHTLFYMADYAGEPGYGMNYNLVPGLPFGPGRISPKPGVPMIRGAIDQVGNAETVGKLDYLGSDIWGYVFQENGTGTLLAAIWDASDRDRKISFDTGAAKVTVVDAFGNTTSQNTRDGAVEVQLSRAPVYVRGLSAQLYGPGRITPLLKTAEVWRVYRGRTATQEIGFNRALGTGATTLTFDTAADVSSAQIKQAVTVKQGSKTTLNFQVAGNAPLGPAAGYLRLRDASGTLYRAVQRIEVAPELEVGLLQADRRTGDWQAVATVKNVAPFAWEGTAAFQPENKAIARQPVKLAPGQQTELRFAVPPTEATRKMKVNLTLTASTGPSVLREGNLSFFEIQRKPAGANFWDALRSVPLKGTAETIYKQHDHAQFRGDADLSAQVAYAYDANNVYVQFRVRDDVHRQDAPPATTWGQDSLQLAFDIAPGRNENANLVAEGFERTRSEWCLAFTPRGPEVYLHIAPGASLVPESTLVTYSGLKLEGGRTGENTVYRLTMPWKLIDPRGQRDKTRLGVGAGINDSDAAGQFTDRRGLELFGGVLRTKSPGAFGVAQLQP